MNKTNEQSVRQQYNALKSYFLNAGKGRILSWWKTTIRKKSGHTEETFTDDEFGCLIEAMQRNLENE